MRGPLAELDGTTALRTRTRAARRRRPTIRLPAALYLDGQLGLVDDMLHYFDRASMAHSLEVRVPFLDHHLVEYCATIPAGYKVRRLETKHVLKRAARGLVPDRIIDKPKIGFFHAAVDAWFARADARRRSATSCSARTRATRRCSIGAASSSSSAATSPGTTGERRASCSRS